MEDSLTLDVDGDRGLLAIGRRFVGSTAGDLLAALDVQRRDVECADRAFSSAVAQQCLCENTNIGSVKVLWGSILQMVNEKRSIKNKLNNSRRSILGLPLECRSKTDCRLAISFSLLEVSEQTLYPTTLES